MTVRKTARRASAHRPWLIATLLLVALSVPIPHVHAQPMTARPQSPVTMIECRGGIASIELVEIAAYDVTLRNSGSVTADAIRLTVRTRRNKLLNFDLKGTFEPKIEVKRRVGRTLGLGFYSYSSTSNECSVDWVHFVDGSSWTKS